MKNLKKLNKKDIIKYLSIDPIFGIYNRNYIEYIIKKKKLKNIYILDFENVGEMNENIGYEEVNKRFKNIFKIVKTDKFKKIYIGRLFSGDEIILATNKKEVNEQINILIDNSKKNDMNFKYFYFKYNIKTILNDKLKKIKWEKN